MTDNIKMPPMPDEIFEAPGPIWGHILDWGAAEPGPAAGKHADAIEAAITRVMHEHAREAVRLNAQAVPDALEKELLQAIQERDAAEDYIDALLDEVLGTDRPEWSSVYGHADAIEQVREMMGALMKPCIDKAWDRFQSAQAAPAAPQPAPDWTPTPENINALPEPVRRYIAELETNCDPAGTVRDLSIARDTIRALEASNRILRDTSQQPLTEKDALLRQALEALEGFANITNDSQGVAGYHLNGDTAEWDEFDEVDAASSAIEAIRNHLGVES